MENKKTDCKKIAITIHELMEIMSCGRATAAKIGENAHASINFGKRKLYNLDKIQEYINSITE